MAAVVQDFLLLAEKAAHAEAGRFARRLGAAAPAEDLAGPDARAKRFLVYLRGDEAPREVKAFLRRAARMRYEKIVLYSARTEPRTAAKWGMVLGEAQPKRTHLCFEPLEVADLLELTPASDRNGIAAARKRLGVTQEELASALKLSPRTIQNWEAGIGLSQMQKRARDLFELVEVLQDYIAEPDQEKWLRSPNAALGGRRPLDLILEGNIREVILEFRRIQEGQPG